MEDEDAPDSSESTLKAEDDRRMSGRGVLLRDDLKGVGDSDRADSPVQDGEGRAQDRLKIQGFPEQSRGEAAQGAPGELPGREYDGVEEFGEPVDEEDVHGEEQGAGGYQDIACIDRTHISRDAEEVQPGDSDHGPRPGGAVGLLSEKDPEYRHEDDVEPGDEPGLARSGGHDPDLLKR